MGNPLVNLRFDAAQICSCFTNELNALEQAVALQQIKIGNWSFPLEVL